ncbi:MAG: transcriptional regulator [Planctomycetes bacterium]|nr:transcriptional regulator [Planctomycetota bacterium]
MLTKDHQPFKTLGPRAAQLVAMLYERERHIFTLADVADITGLREPSLRSFVRTLVDRGVAMRLRSGLFILVPFELGSAREYLGNPYVVARELMGSRIHYLSHASAMDLHGMVTQPQLAVCVTSPAPMRGRTIHGTEFHFVRCKPSDVFGTTEHWVEKQEKVVVSDLERTIIDGLKQPEHCGGLTEVAKGLSIRLADMNARKLVDYALRLNIGAVTRRLGYLMETYGIGSPEELGELRANLTSTYNLFDPILPSEGKFLARWRLRLNVSPEEIQAVGRS